MNESQTCKMILRTCLYVEYNLKCYMDYKLQPLSSQHNQITLTMKFVFNSFIMPHTSFIEKSRKHNFHFERNPQKILQLRKLIMALRHLIKAAKVTKRKLIWWRWKAFVFKYVSLETTNIQQGFKDTELCKYDVFDIHTHNDSLEIFFNRIIKLILYAMYEITFCHNAFSHSTLVSNNQETPKYILLQTLRSKTGKRKSFVSTRRNQRNQLCAYYKLFWDCCFEE